MHQDHQLRKPVMVSPADLDHTEAGGAESRAYGPLQRPRLSVWSLPRARVLAVAPKDLDSVWIPTLDPRCRQEAVPLGRGVGGGCLTPCTLTVRLNFYQELRSVSADNISHLAGGGRERRSSHHSTAGIAAGTWGRKGRWEPSHTTGTPNRGTIGAVQIHVQIRQLRQRSK